MKFLAPFQLLSSALSSVVSRLRERSLAERKAMFFATFMISSALIFTFWANSMYSQFGIAFGLPPKTGSEVLTEKTDFVADSGLTSPLEALKESVGTLKTETMNLFSALSMNLKMLGLFPAETNKELAKKEPPVLVFDSQNPSLNIGRESAGSDTRLVFNAASVEDKIGANEEAGTEEQKISRPPASSGKKSLIARMGSIIFDNLASTRQAFTDFYEYLTR